jgi:hypothetical protein
MSDWNIPTFLFAADEIDDLTLSQACETIENENYAFENLGILSLNNEAENATLTQACEMVENTRCDIEDFTFSHDLNEYFKADDHGSFSMDYDVAGDFFPKTEPTSEFLMEDADNSTSRFAEPVTDKYIEELINNHENKNTKKNTGWAVGVFEKWRNFGNTGANIAKAKSCCNRVQHHFRRVRWL